MDLDEFKLDRAVLEVRYPRAYLLWDRAGMLWTRLEKNWPELINQEASPARTVFVLELENSYQLATELAASKIIAHDPKENLHEFCDVVAEFVDVVQSVLALDTFSRIGFRLSYFCKKSSLDEAARFVKDTNMVRVPDGPVFSLEPESVNAEVILVFKGANIGARVQINAATKVFEFTPPLGAPMKKIRDESHGVIYDVDYFTVVEVGSAQIDFKEWIREAHHRIRRDSASFLARG